MNRFVFRLEPLLEYKNRLKEISAKELSQSQALFDGHETRLTALGAEYERTGRECERLREEGGDGSAIGLYYDYLTGLSSRIEAQAEALKAAEADLEKKRERLLAAKKETMAVELLKERSRAAYDSAVNRDEQKASDEVASAVHKRGAQG